MNTAKNVSALPYEKPEVQSFTEAELTATIDAIGSGVGVGASPTTNEE